MIARNLQDSPHPIAKFNQHVVLPHLFPEYQPKGGFPVDTNVMDDTGMTDAPASERLLDSRQTKNDASFQDANVKLTTTCGREKVQGLKSESDASELEVDGDSTASNSVSNNAGSMKLEVRY